MAWGMPRACRAGTYPLCGDDGCAATLRDPPTGPYGREMARRHRRLRGGCIRRRLRGDGDGCAADAFADGCAATVTVARHMHSVPGLKGGAGKGA
jgi:hypothetical protein